MTTPATPCPWWCTHHRSGDSAEDEQHARLFGAPSGVWVALLQGSLPDDPIEIAYGAESYVTDPAEAREFAAALHQVADLFERLRLLSPARTP